jgi:selenium donor protein
MGTTGSNFFGNPSSSHEFGMQARHVIEDARIKVADLLNTSSGEIVFTSGGTESNNMAIKGAAFANSGKGNHIIISSVEHPAVREVCEWMQRFGFRITTLQVDAEGMVNPEDVRKAITSSTILVSVMHANNEVGTIQPIAEIGRITRESGILFHTDAAQSVGKIPVDVEQLQVDLLSVAGHKWYGPKGIGALYIRRGTKLEKFMHGADHEGNQRAGTENIIYIAGLGKAAEIIRFDENGQLFKRPDQVDIKLVTDLLYDLVIKKIPEIRMNGHPIRRLPNTLSVGFPGTDATRLLRAMPQVAASAGAACHADKEEISQVLRAMQVPYPYAIGTIRFSTGRMTTRDDVMEASEYIVRAFHKVARMKTGFQRFALSPVDDTSINPDRELPSPEKIQDTEMTTENHADESVEVRLTAYTHALGCACKIRPQYLERMLGRLPASRDNSVLVGFETSDDAAVYSISDEQAIVQTVDLIPPVVDDPYMYGAIAAANAISDIYAMGGSPSFALSIIGFPDKELSPDILEKILKGLHDKVAEAGIEIIGGHTIEDEEPKSGLVVTGLINPNKILLNQGARPGDLLLLTKPLGTGVIMTALKNGIAKPQDVQMAMQVMALLNRDARDIMVTFPVHACTDVTGFGLLGHLKEMVRGTSVSVILELSAIPVLPGVPHYIMAGMVPGGTRNNFDFVADTVEWDDRIDELSKLILCDAQTSGGLLIALPEAFAGLCQEKIQQSTKIEASMIGHFVKGDGKIRVG